mmetsp:Transcript_9750/g.27292  ORF Transcript_9750/g.27292 Transcript_9750/m.27292 type:complete len:291 (-) Transcript_9750:1082-1954(-)
MAASSSAPYCICLVYPALAACRPSIIRCTEPTASCFQVCRPCTSARTSSRCSEEPNFWPPGGAPLEAEAVAGVPSRSHCSCSGLGSWRHLLSSWGRPANCRLRGLQDRCRVPDGPSERLAEGDREREATSRAARMSCLSSTPRARSALTLAAKPSACARSSTISWRACSVSSNARCRSEAKTWFSSRRPRRRSTKCSCSSLSLVWANSTLLDASACSASTAATRCPAAEAAATCSSVRRRSCSAAVLPELRAEARNPCRSRSSLREECAVVSATFCFARSRSKSSCRERT